MHAYIFTTDNSTAFIVAVGNDEKDARANADQSVQALPGVKITGQQLVNHSIVVNLSITMFTKAKSDDILMRKIVEKFGDRAKIELRNEMNDNGSMRKHFLVDDNDEIHLDLRNKQQVESYEDKGLSEEHMKIILERLEEVLSRNELKISVANNGEEKVEPYTADEMQAKTDADYVE